MPEAPSALPPSLPYARPALLDFVRQHLPFADHTPPSTDHPPGGRTAALARLPHIRPHDYANTRNYLTGQVTRLSPYLRHGCLSLAEVRDAALEAAGPQAAHRLIQELAWRDYFLRLHDLLGDAVWTDLEPLKTGHSPKSYAPTLPDDIAQAQTGLACIDDFARTLRETGYLHNHARMWTAAYVIHHRRVKWQAGALWFLRLLLDGDEASNNLSWQWVASSFSAKPYFFNRENLDRYTAGHYCPTCPARTHCPFDADYPTLEARLFPQPPHPDVAASPTRTLSLKVHSPIDDKPSTPPAPAIRPALVWAHEDALSADHPAYALGHPVLFIFDTPHYNGFPHSLQRLLFITESAADFCHTRSTPYEVGDPVRILLSHAARLGLRDILVPTSPSPRIKQICQSLEKAGLTVHPIPPAPFTTTRHPYDLTRFSRFWRRAEPTALQPTKNQPT